MQSHESAPSGTVLAAAAATLPSSPAPSPNGSATPSAITPTEGRHVLHAFFSLDRAAWQEMKKSRRAEAVERFVATTRRVAQWPGGQILLFSCVGPKADWGFLLLADNLHDVDRTSKSLHAALGPGVLRPVASYLSLTERSEYTTTEEEYRAQLQAEEGLAEDSADLREKVEAFRARMAKYTQDRLYPILPHWPVLCFYPMAKRRAPSQNWYALPFAERRKLMQGHARVGRNYAGRVLQLITGSTGLDAMEWGVTLLARSLSDIKSIVYEMRFDPVSAQYAEFGDFYIGLTLSAEDLVERLAL